MGKSFDGEVKEHWMSIKLLSILMSIMPVMEAVDKLHDAVFKKRKREKKQSNDIKYWQHELELLEMDQRVYELLTNKKNGRTND
jgi:hypothetical protein